MDTSKELLRIWADWLDDMIVSCGAILGDTEAARDPENDELMIAIDDVDTTLRRQLLDLKLRLEE
jgi:hypothetical protein